MNDASCDDEKQDVLIRIKPSETADPLGNEGYRLVNSEAIAGAVQGAWLTTISNTTPRSARRSILGVVGYP